MGTTTTQMTSRERWLAAANLEPVDRLPFWPKLNGSYPPAQTGKFQNMSLPDFHKYIGSDRHEGVGSILSEKRTNTEVRQENETNRKITTYATPYGETRRVTEFDETSRSWHPVEFPVKDLESLKIMKAFFADADVELDNDKLAQANDRCQQLKEEDCITMTGIGESPLMRWVEWLAGVEQAHLLLLDHQDEVEALFAEMHRLLKDSTKLVSENAPCDLLYFTENTSTTLISPNQYRQYCLPQIMEYANIAREADRHIILHMCGTLKDLLPDLAKIPVTGFEAFTSPPVGNTRLQDGRRECPDKCLVGGTNAILWTKSSDEIIAELEEDLNELPHHRGIVVTSAGVMPPLAAPDTIREVCEWVKNYPCKA